MWPICLPSLGSATSSGRENTAVHVAPAAPPVPLPGWGPLARVHDSTLPLSSQSSLAFPDASCRVWDWRGLDNLLPVWAGDSKPCLGYGVQAWGSDLCQGAEREAQSVSFRCLKGTRLSPRRGRFALSGHR